MDMLKALAPHAIAGYSDELKAVKEQNIAELVRVVDERKAELSGMAYTTREE